VARGRAARRVRVAAELAAAKVAPFPPGLLRSSGSPKPTWHTRKRWSTPLLDTLYGGFILPSTTTTILQDWNKGRHSEVDDINGHVVRVSEQFGFSAPINAAIVELAHGIEAGVTKPGVEHLERLRAAAGLTL